MKSKVVAGGLAGVFIGAVLGVPLSYYLQPGFLRMMFPVGKYVANFGEVLDDKSLSGTAISSIIGFAVLFSIVGACFGALLGRKQNES